MSLVTKEFITQYILKLTLNDPDNLNAMGEEMAKEFDALVNDLASGVNLPRAIIITGVGRAFSAGGNLSMLEKKTEISPEANRSIMRKFYESFLHIRNLNIPLIAAINGAAVGAGLCLAAACDIRLASSQAKLGFTFVKLGLHPGMGATYFLRQILGDAIATELLLTGRIIDAKIAHEIGLISYVCEPDKLLDRAFEIAIEICSSGPNSVSYLLQSLRRKTGSLEECLEREALCQSISYASEEFKEGVRAAIEKRQAGWVVK